MRALGAVDLSEALDEVLGEALRTTGAVAAAVVDADGRVQAAVQTGDEAQALEAAIRGGDGAELPGGGRALSVSLELRGARVGRLIACLPGGGRAVDGTVGALEALGCVVALLLENERLYEEARLARQSRDHFLVALHHELRTPAAGLLLNADALHSGLFGEVPATAARVLERVKADVTELVRVLEGVLDLGVRSEKAREGRGELLEPRRFVADLLHRVEPMARRKGLRLTLHAPEYLPPLQADAGHLSRILLRLLGNAIRFTERGGVRVRMARVTAAPRGRREPLLEIVVGDTGCGIPAGQLQRVLEPFAQVGEGARTDSRSRGVGLGLSLAKHLAETLGGELRIASVEGKGTDVTVMVPYRRDGP